MDRSSNRNSQTPTGLATGRVGSQSIAYNSSNRNTASGWTYDDAGNVTGDGTGGHNYTYDAESRVIQIDSSAIEYAYDAAGRRIKRKAPADSSSVTTYYLYGLTGLMSEFTTVNTGKTQAASDDRVQYRIGEQTRTPVMHVDPDGIARENNRVFPFGEPWSLPAASTSDQNFTTYQRDSESGLDYAMARYYGSRNGRFMTPDPGHVGADIADSQSWNAYAYSRKDPVNFIDPTGLKYDVCLFGFHGDSGGCATLSDDRYEELLAMEFKLVELPTSIGYGQTVSVFCTNEDVHCGYVYRFPRAERDGESSNSEGGSGGTTTPARRLMNGPKMAAQHGSVSQCLFEGIFEAGLDVFNISLLPDADLDSWVWNWQRLGFDYRPEAGGGVPSPPIFDMAKRGSKFVNETPPAKRQIRDAARKVGYNVSYTDVSTKLSTIARFAGSMAKILAAKSGLERYEKCRGY